jgi:translation initiation factor IF-3
VVSEEGENIGVLKTGEALKLAQEKDLDLVVIAEKANPPVAKILDFNKYLYDERKKQSAIKAKAKKAELKELVFGPTIDEGDLNVRISRSRHFLEEGNRVRITIRMRGRENEHPEIALEKLKKIAAGLQDLAKPEDEPKRTGNIISVTYVRI